MTALFVSSTSLSKSDGSSILPTGGLGCVNDSVLVAYDDLRLANAKMVELKYEKAKNEKLLHIIENDSIALSRYATITEKYKKDCKKHIQVRNITFGIAVATTLMSIILLVK